MTIKIVRNSDGNCITFEGSSNPVYFNSCLSGEVDPTFPNTINVINDIATAQSADVVYEFFQIPYTEFRDADNNAFASATDAASYITAQGNVISVEGSTYLGLWDASTNTPALVDSTHAGLEGDFYYVSVAGSTALDGVSAWKRGDKVIWNGTTWQKLTATSLIDGTTYTTLLNTQTSVFADGEGAVADETGLPGWYYKNTENNKINWYVYGDTPSISNKLGDLQVFYAVITPKNTTSEPYFSVYTVPQGDGEDQSWYRSRVTYYDQTNLQTMVAGTQYLVHSATINSALLDSIDTLLPRISLGIDSATTIGLQGSTEELFLMALSTSSNFPAGTNEFTVEKIGYVLGDHQQEFTLSAPPTTGASIYDETPASIDFRREATDTTILASDGQQFSVNSIHAEGNGDGTINIHRSPGDQVVYSNLIFGNITILDVQAGANESGTVNALNSLFSNLPLGAGGSYVPSYPTIEAVNVTRNGGEIGTVTTKKSDGVTDHLQTVSGTSGHDSRYWSTETIDTAGEYFLVKICGNGRFILGLGDTNGDDLAQLNNNVGGAADGLFFGLAFYDYGSYTAPWTTYGSSAGLSYGPGWNGSTNVQMRYNGDVQTELTQANLRDGALFKVGIDNNGYISVWYYDVNRSNDFILCGRRSTTTPASDYNLVVKLWDQNATLVEHAQIVASDPVAPALTYYYIESPDGSFYYPLFKTTDEAEYVDVQNGGSGNSHAHVFVDEPTNTTWYMPSTGGTHAGGSAPANTAEITYNVIGTYADELYAPATFDVADLTVDEGVTVNYQIAPLGAPYTTSVSGLPAGLTYDGLQAIIGSAPLVQGNNVDNPSDAFVVTVTRANDYGSTVDTFTLTVTNLTAPAVAASGFTHDATSATLVDSNTMSEGSAVDLDDTLDQGKRLTISQSFIETNVLPNMAEDGDAFYIGLRDGAVDFSNGVQDADFDFALKLERTAAGQHKSTLLDNTSGTVVNEIFVQSLSDSFYDYAIEYDGTNVYLVACNMNDINTQPGVANGGSFGRVLQIAAPPVGPHQVVFATHNMQAGISTVGVDEIAIPYGANDIRVSEVSETEAHFDVGGGPVTADNITLNAGYTYRFYLNDSSIESGDVLTFETFDGTPYTTGVTTVGTHGDYNYYVQFAVPSDVPPIHPVWNGTDLPTLQISGSTYVASVTGITLEGPVANQTGTNLFNAPVGGSVEWGWLSIDEQLGAGQRLVLNNAFLVDLTEAMPNDSMVQIGLKDATFSTNNRSNSSSNFEGGARFEIFRYSASDIRFLGYVPGAPTISKFVGTNGVLNNSMELAIDLTGSGNNIRLMIGSSSNSSDSVTSTAYADWNSSYKAETGDQGYGLTSVDVVILGDGQTVGNLDQADGAFNSSDVDWTGLSEISVPTPAAALTTTWTKALDFSGGSERAEQVNSSNLYAPLKMGGINNNVSANPLADYTSNDANARPWATSIVFSSDNNASNQHVWNLGEGAGTTDDNIYLRVDASRNLYFGWARTGEVNECSIGTLSATAGTWQGVYIASTGERLGLGHSAQDIADCFDIRLVNLQTGAAGSNLSNATNWTAGSFGARMNRAFDGFMTVGGRGTNRTFHGKVAAMVVTTLRTNVPMPADAEISMMVRDPMQWLTDYKVGQNYRRPSVATDSTNFQLDGYDPASSTQVWLMGDGTSDAYARIQNQVYAAETTRYPLEMFSMLSNDIETVTIPGLS